MKSRIREKLIAGVMLSAFVITNSFTAGLALDDYNGYGTQTPELRTEGYSSVGMHMEEGIPNGDSVVNLSLRDADVKQVLRMFADQAGMNIIFSSDIEGQVTMDLVDVPLSEALQLVVKTSKLYYDIKANTLVVSTEEESLSMTDRNQNITIVPVKYVNALVLSDFLNKSIFSPKGKGAVRPGISKGFIVATNPATNELIVTGTEKDVALVKRVVEQFDKKPTLTTFKVNHTTPAEMSALICGSLFPSMTIVDAFDQSSGGAAGVPTGFASDDSSDSSGGGGGSIAVGGGKLACVLSTQQKTEESSGDEETYSLSSLPLLNLSVSYFPTLGTIQVLGGSESQLDMIRDYIATNDKKAPQAFLEIQIISLSESGSKTFDNTWSYISKNFSFNADKGGGFRTDSLHPIFLAGKGYYTLKTDSWDSEAGGHPTAKVPFPFAGYESQGYAGKNIQGTHLSYAVNYLIENNKGRVLANPKVLLTSGQTSVIDLTSDYVSKVTTQYLDNGGMAAQVQRDVEVSDDNGIKVTVTPFISPDGYVTLDITPNYKTIKDKYYTDGEAGKDLAATLLQRSDLNLKGIRIKDGETLVIGGMIQETETKSVAKIPFLGDLPVIGMFFRSTSTTKGKEETVIMITPQIVVDTEDSVADDVML
ncbi:MAG: hypothetical protein NC191_08085 [Muribaculaceae bacterium]|nr:hypothetical protein [Muribaculaceae bacterium]